MSLYRYYLIPDAMKDSSPTSLEAKMPAEFYDNTTELKRRYLQLRERTYNNEPTWNERTKLPDARMVLGIDRQDPDGGVTIIQVRAGVNYLWDDYRSPYMDHKDEHILKMAKELIETIGVDRVRPRTWGFAAKL